MTQAQPRHEEFDQENSVRLFKWTMCSEHTVERVQGRVLNCFAQINFAIFAFQKPRKRKYPIGIQTFERIIEEGYVYKTKRITEVKMEKL